MNSTLDALAKAHAAYMEALKALTPAGRSQSLAITHAETAALWAAKAVIEAGG